MRLDTNSKPLMFFKKALDEVKAVISTLVSIYFGSPRLWTYNKNKL